MGQKGILKPTTQMFPANLKNQIKVFAVDLDDTLFQPDLTIAPFDAHMLCKLQQSGVHVAFSSGRMAFDIRPRYISAGLSLDNAYAVGGGGGEVVRLSDKKKVFCSSVDEETIRTMFTYGKEHNFCCEFYSEEGVILYTTDNKAHDYHMSILTIKDVKVSYEEIIERAIKEKPLKLFITEDPETIEHKVIPDIRARLNASSRAIITKPEFCEVLNVDVSKSTALSFYCENILGCTIANCFAMGDGGNDIEMLRDSGFSAAPANSTDGAKAVAKITLPWKNTDNAVGRAIDAVFFDGQEFDKFHQRR
ncbi:putative Cof-type HAD-IIB family hydrolase [Blattamonas nauphoetae]|uniref:Cof-type HAD-IIB family hydrolase n=1 Tax=Blattamonas nauphoetae TaxID=2049346 RepID=A0ABQ9Y639_9EUKA|nr:putative Cof-type HAD-IIB family hydrolase [Blattamonas nauphoetae]